MAEFDTNVLILISANEDAASAKESLDVVYACAVFGINIDVVIRNDAIKLHLLLTAETADGLNVPKQWSAAALYGVNSISVLAHELAEVKLQVSQLIADINVINNIPNAENYKHIIEL